MPDSFPLSDQYMDWYIADLRRRELAEQSARRLASDFLVFVSYSWADEYVAKGVTNGLERRGIRYVQDRKDVTWGDSISEWAREGLRRSTHYLLILTKTSAASRWCAYEYGVADGLGKGMLTFIAESELDIPPFASGHAAVRELRDVESFFAKARIDEREVERFIEDVLGVKLDELARFVPRRDGDLRGWDAPDRDKREHERQEIRGVSGGVDLDGPPETLGIEVNPERGTLALDAKKHGYRTQRYEVSYVPELTAAVVTPKKEGSTTVGVLEESGDGEPHLRPGGSSVEDQLSGNTVYGWPVSTDFWLHAIRRLERLLAASS